MRILWITNIEFPEALSLLTGEGELRSSGGWLLGAAKALLALDDEIELFVTSVSRRVKELTFLEGKEIGYYLIPYGKGNKTKNPEYEPFFLDIKNKVKPDVVHIHGTEFSHGLAYIDACGSENVVISIQGLVSVINHYYGAGLTHCDILKGLTLRDCIKGSIFSAKRAYRKRGEYEIEMLKKTKHVIGRTSWDKAHVWAINPQVHYHFCNETLRTEFYDGSSWEYGKCVPHSIFLSQAYTPIKGLHQILKAMPLILRQFPDTQIRVAGNNITFSGTLISKLKISGYGKIIKLMIQKYHLEKCLFFTGKLNANQMKEEYLKCNVFVCPSSIENSSNSIGEAQILGTPVVASFVGGIPDMMVGDEKHLYRFDDIEMLALKICGIFSGKGICSLKKEAQKRHSPIENAKKLKEIYYSIVE